jgi:mono/diheme cytochrome c family protein
VNWRGRVTIGSTGLAAIAVLAVLLASGCGYGGVASAADHPDLQNGQTLFVSSCGYCHTLQAAGTSGTVGPDLDNAFAGARMEGFAVSAIENVVLDQIRLGSGSIMKPYTTPQSVVKNCTGPDAQTTCLQQEMPANRVTGQDAIDVAAYVASVAGISGFTTPVNLAGLTSGAEIFKAAGCSGCHTLKAAGATGTVGPNLDQLAGKLTLPIVIRQVTNGGAIMPPFKSKLTPAQIQAVAQYVIANAGK